MESHDAKTLRMANPNGNPQNLKNYSLQTSAKPLSPKTRPVFSQAVSGMRALQQLMIAEALDPELKPLDRASIARALVYVCDCVQRLRGVPTPGQLRPDLDRVQLAKMIKRAKNREPIDLVPSGPSSGKFYDDPEPDKIAPKKESLSNDGGVTGRPGGEGEKTDGGSY